VLVFNSFELQCRDIVHENNKREELTTADCMNGLCLVTEGIHEVISL
jgi:hypothetical protein